MTSMQDVKIGFIGYGNMATAMADGWITAGQLTPANMCACAGHFEALQPRCEARGMRALATAEEVIAASEVVVVAIKPYMIERVLSPLTEQLAGKVILSVAWGWDNAKWEALLPGTAHVSCVPNTPVSVNQGVIVAERTHTLSEQQHGLVLELLGQLGMVVELGTDVLFAGGTVGGCGPAFVAMVIEALADASVKHGIPRADAYRIVSQMLAGTAKLQLETGQHPGAMKDAVCSPGGATIKGVAELEAAGLRSALIRAVDAVL